MRLIMSVTIGREEREKGPPGCHRKQLDSAPCKGVGPWQVWFGRVILSGDLDEMNYD